MFEPVIAPLVIFWPIGIGDGIPNAVDCPARIGGDPTGDPNVIGSIRTSK